MDTWTFLSNFPRGGLKHRCAMPGCSSSTPPSQLRHCSDGCNIVRYCSPEHEKDHRDEHKTECNRMAEIRARELEDDAHAVEAGFVPGQSPGPNVRHMNFRLSGRGLMQTTATLDSCTEVLARLEKILQDWNERDARGANIVPFLMLRLDQDQRCYDFIRRRMINNDEDSGSRSSSDAALRQTSGPSTGGPALQAGMQSSDPSVHHLVALLVLNLKLLVDVNNIKITRKVLPTTPLPADLYRHVEANVIRSPLAVRLLEQKYSGSKELQEFEKKLVLEIQQIGAKITERNKFFWHHMFNPDKILRNYPQPNVFMVCLESRVALNCSCLALWENQGILELLELLLQAAVIDNTPEIMEILEREGPAVGTLSECSRFPKLVAEVCLDGGRLWKSMDLALQDASFLGPEANKSSRERAGSNFVLFRPSTLSDIAEKYDVAERLSDPMLRMNLLQLSYFPATGY